MGFTSWDISCLTSGGADSFIPCTPEIVHHDDASSCKCLDASARVSMRNEEERDTAILIKVYLQLLIYLCHCILQPFDLQNKPTQIKQLTLQRSAYKVACLVKTVNKSFIVRQLWYLIRLKTILGPFQAHFLNMSLLHKCFRSRWCLDPCCGQLP